MHNLYSELGGRTSLCWCAIEEQTGEPEQVSTVCEVPDSGNLVVLTSGQPVSAESQICERITDLVGTKPVVCTPDERGVIGESSGVYRILCDLLVQGPDGRALGLTLKSLKKLAAHRCGECKGAVPQRYTCQACHGTALSKQVRELCLGAHSFESLLIERLEEIPHEELGEPMLSVMIRMLCEYGLGEKTLVTPLDTLSLFQRSLIALVSMQGGTEPIYCSSMLLGVLSRKEQEVVLSLLSSLRSQALIVVESARPLRSKNVDAMMRLEQFVELK